MIFIGLAESVCVEPRFLGDYLLFFFFLFLRIRDWLLQVRQVGSHFHEMLCPVLDRELLPWLELLGQDFSDSFRVVAKPIDPHQNDLIFFFSEGSPVLICDLVFRVWPGSM
jgi:hypothetical protein